MYDKNVAQTYCKHFDRRIVYSHLGGRGGGVATQKVVHVHCEQMKRVWGTEEVAQSTRAELLDAGEICPQHAKSVAKTVS